MADLAKFCEASTMSGTDATAGPNSNTELQGLDATKSNGARNRTTMSPVSLEANLKKEANQSLRQGTNWMKLRSQKRWWKSLKNNGVAKRKNNALHLWQM